MKMKTGGENEEWPRLQIANCKTKTTNLGLALVMRDAVDMVVCTTLSSPACWQFIND